MKHVQMLDCTLRDGGYLLDKKFGDNNINGIVQGLIEAKIDWIEIGFLQDEGFGAGKTVFKNSKSAEKYIPTLRGNSNFTVLADYSRYSIENLDENNGRSFSAVRACFFKDERIDVLDFCREIKKMGYKLFVQPVDVLGYSDIELIEFIKDINVIEPDCFSIVDTFGSMYEDDLQRVFSLIDSNLISECKIDFHSHNNLQMSSALSQAFIKMSFGRREVVVDSTISGMGRGAGNTPTELIAQYLVSKWGYHYNIDAILDVIDIFIDNIRTKCTWGYSTPFFIAGSYGSHVNNVDYLLKKNSILSKDIRYILNHIGDKRKRYDYDLLESEYLEYLKADIDDSTAISALRKMLFGKNIVVIAPGKSAKLESERIKEYIGKSNAFVISINFLPDIIKTDFLYMSNIKRYIGSEDVLMESKIKKIFTSNIKAFKEEGDEDEYIVSFNRLIKCGWERMDNSAIMLMRLLNQLDVASIGVAGLDGYDYLKNTYNYVNNELELSSSIENPDLLNREIEEMLYDFYVTKNPQIEVKFITTSRFEKKLRC